MAMKITPHFSLSEFDRPARRGFPASPYPARWIESRLRPLAELLEVIRGRVDCPIVVLSAWRELAYNRAIGSLDTSQHVQGRAGDIVAPEMRTITLHAEILALYRDGTLRGRPTRLGGLGDYGSAFVHVDTRPGTRLARWRGSRTAT